MHQHLHHRSMVYFGNDWNSRQSSLRFPASQSHPSITGSQSPRWTVASPVKPAPPSAAVIVGTSTYTLRTVSVVCAIFSNSAENVAGIGRLGSLPWFEDKQGLQHRVRNNLVLSEATRKHCRKKYEQHQHRPTHD